MSKKTVIAVFASLLLITCGQSCSRQGKSSKVATAMKEMMNIATGMIDYTTDHGMAPENSGAFEKGNDFYNSLVPHYLKELPIYDPWGNHYLVYGGESCKGNYGIANDGVDDTLVVSLGADRVGPSSDDLVLFNGEWMRGS